MIVFTMLGPGGAMAFMKMDAAVGMRFLLSLGLPHERACRGIVRWLVQHRRVGPRANAFRYPLCFVGLDLDRARRTLAKLPWASWRSPAWARFHRGDYCGDPKQDLAAHIRQVICQHTGQPLTGSVELITHLRQGGHCFNR